MSNNTTPKRPRAARLKTLDDVRRYLAKLVNEVRAGDCDPQIASKIGYLLNILSSCIKDTQIEERLAELEARLAEDHHG